MNHNKPIIQQQEEPSFTSFNVQSSAFFNNHLSSKSSDANDFLTLQLKTQSKVSMKSNHSQVKRKSFDFSYEQAEGITKPKKENSTVTSNDFFACHANSANVHNYGNYVLKFEMKKNSKYVTSGFDKRVNENPILKYYGNNHSFFRTSRNITNGNNNNIDKNICGLGDIDSNGESAESDIEDNTDNNNYIIQRILTIIVGDARMKAITMIVQWYDEIKVLPFGPRLIAKLSERYGEFNMLVGNKYNNTMRTVNNSNSSNIGNVNFIQMNNYMFSPQTTEMYMNMMKQQNMYNNQYGYPNYGNMYQQQQYPMQYGYMKPKGKSNHYG